MTNITLLKLRTFILTGGLPVAVLLTLVPVGISLLYVAIVVRQSIFGASESPTLSSPPANSHPLLNPHSHPPTHTDILACHPTNLYPWWPGRVTDANYTRKIGRHEDTGGSTYEVRSMISVICFGFLVHAIVSCQRLRLQYRGLWSSLPSYYSKVIGSIPVPSAPRAMSVPPSALLLAIL